MSIWMDLTNTMRIWDGGCVGIVRAELEIAKNLKKENPEIRFCVSEEIGFSEIKSEELEWLWKSDSVSDAYIKHFNRNNKSNEFEMPEGLEKAINTSTARIERARILKELIHSKLHGIKKILAIIIINLIYIPLKIISKFNNGFRNKLINKKDNYEFTHPFKEGDIIFSCGWYTSNKEYQYSRLKSLLGNIKLIYLIYDLITVKKDLKFLYNTEKEFSEYLTWISTNCDYIFYGGETTKKDAEEFFKENKLPIKKGFPVKFGSNIIKKVNSCTKENVLKKYNILDKYILAVGSIDPKKNYMIIYKAYKLMLQSMSQEKIPQLVIVGEHSNGITKDFIKNDTEVCKKIILITPSNEELDIIYRNCKFTILPSVYEGWSLMLSESLNYGKFCLCSDIEPLREIAGELVDYVETMDSVEWMNKILYYNENDEILKSYSEKIEKKWKLITWKDCGKQVNNYLLQITNEKLEYSGKIYYDLTLAWHSIFAQANVSGILRTQLQLAKNLIRDIENIEYIVLLDDKYVTLDKYSINQLFSSKAIEEGFKELGYQIKCLINQKTSAIYEKGKKLSRRERFKEVIWLTISLFPSNIQKMIVNHIKKINKKNERKINKKNFLLPFKENDVFFSAGMGYSEHIYAVIENSKKKNNFKYFQLIYDFTPIIVPQTHTEKINKFYKVFLDRTYKLSDIVFYGGETAMLDGLKYAKNNNLPERKGIPVKFGSDVTIKLNLDDTKLREKVFEKYNIDKSYIMAVGSIEARKNHDILYQAYLELMKTAEDLPQMIFCGYPGWKTEELLERLERDERIKNKIIIITPDDTELEILYKNSLFTVLASLYEGWSLTLPESLNYGKFCITSDVAPLKETGGNFIDYANPYNAKEWAEKILYYYKNLDKLEEKNRNIEENWKSITWEECAKNLAKELKKY
ncbi:glycosyltransferase [Leptotrichia sp. HSP-536]|uniref:Glycosyltransferase n=1 Tax=Leptotrichia alba TaxID=3239304 RepID=A0AB39V415_9FUSO